MSLTFLLGLLSAILIAVAFRHLTTYVVSLFCLLDFIFILLFSRAVAIAVSWLLFFPLGLPCHSSLFSAIFNSRHHFYCHTIYRCHLFCHCLARQQLSHLYISMDLSIVGLAFLLWSCRCHIHFPAKDAFIVTYRSLPHLFCFSGLFFLSFSRCHILIAVPILIVQPIAIHML